ncbi:hypothetical protein BR93DRAFT_746167 [Coniochaeta sp. PMI_546]|nr:hypothetical protein BR93DRAFT_746167 [Coniochaeta sp. PMI_546]
MFCPCRDEGEVSLGKLMPLGIQAALTWTGQEYALPGGGIYNCVLYSFVIIIPYMVGLQWSAPTLSHAGGQSRDRGEETYLVHHGDVWARMSLVWLSGLDTIIRTGTADRYCHHASHTLERSSWALSRHHAAPMQKGEGGLGRLQRFDLPVAHILFVLLTIASLLMTRCSDVAAIPSTAAASPFGLEEGCSISSAFAMWIADGKIIGRMS